MAQSGEPTYDREEIMSHVGHAIEMAFKGTVVI